MVIFCYYKSLRVKDEGFEKWLSRYFVREETDPNKSFISFGKMYEILLKIENLHILQD